jgi:hypothetical protein
MAAHPAAFHTPPTSGYSTLGSAARPMSKGSGIDRCTGGPQKRCSASYEAVTAEGNSLRLKRYLMPVLRWFDCRADGRLPNQYEPWNGYANKAPSPRSCTSFGWAFLRGYDRPRSQFRTVQTVTPICLATSACSNPRLVRNWQMR